MRFIPSRLPSRRLVACVVLLVIAVPAISLGRALMRDDGLSILGKGAAWGRNHGLSWFVDKAEEIRYGAPPSKDAATELDTAIPDVTTAPAIDAPANLTTPLPNPLPNEGTWIPVRSVSGRPVVWTTGVRPSSQFPSITASYALIDPEVLRARMYNGTEVPGGSGWLLGNKVADADRSGLVFAFNGGFRKEHSRGGYYTEGRLVWPLVEGSATIAIDKQGRMSLGVWGTDAGFNDQEMDRWATIRQNLLPTVVDGRPSPELKRGYWGGGKKGEIFILRSAVCIRYDGLIMFAIAGPTDATTLASALADAGCRMAMQLDQNESYPRGYVFTPESISEIDSRMMGKTSDYLTGSLREFFAFFE